MAYLIGMLAQKNRIPLLLGSSIEMRELPSEEVYENMNRHHCMENAPNIKFDKMGMAP